jgi:hypothetical protein
MNRDNKVKLPIWFRSQSSAVIIVSDCELYDQGLIPDRAKGFSSSFCIWTGSGTHPASCPMGTGGSFPGSKARLGCDTDNLLPSSAEVKKDMSCTSSPPKHLHGV